MRYAFIRDESKNHPVKTLCKVMKVHRSGYYAWLNEPLSNRAKEDENITKEIIKSWNESGCIYGYRKVH